MITEVPVIKIVSTLTLEAGLTCGDDDFNDRVLGMFESVLVDRAKRTMTFIDVTCGCVLTCDLTRRLSPRTSQPHRGLAPASSDKVSCALEVTQTPVTAEEETPQQVLAQVYLGVFASSNEVNEELQEAYVASSLSSQGTALLKTVSYADEVLIDTTVVVTTLPPIMPPTVRPTSSPVGAPPGAGTAFVWYPNFAPGSQHCRNDGQEESYMRTQPTIWLFASREECCARFFGWAFEECAAGASSGSPALLSNQFFADYSSSSCLQDCEPGPFGCAVVPPPVALYDSIDACCSMGMGWVDYRYCTSRSTGSYTDGWVVDFLNDKCSKSRNLWSHM